MMTKMSDSESEDHLTDMIPWGPTGEAVYKRTYSRTKPDGTKETWPETAARVARGNLELVYGPQLYWPPEVCAEFDELVEHMIDFKILPGGRHLWASGVKGRQYLFNCHVAGWGEKLSDHFEFTFMRLMEGGGVGSNYSSKYLAPYGLPGRRLHVHIVCDSDHPDYEAMLNAGLLSDEYASDWGGAFIVEDSREGWAAALVDLLDTYMDEGDVQHENRVYDVTNVRPKGSRLKTFGGTASGPEPFARMMSKVAVVMNEANERSWECVDSRGDHLWPTEAMAIDHAIAECVVSGGNRRSARMAICHWNDPYIDNFLRCKEDPSENWTTNVSVEIDNEFVGHVRLPEPAPEESYDVFGDKIYRTEREEAAAWAHELHRRVVRGMLTNGEPGYWNSDLSNVGEPNPVIATNPCGEIALEAWENCNLGHVNLDAFALDSGVAALNRAHRLITRFLMRATYGDVNDGKQGEKLARNRRIGVGHMGVQGFLAKRGIPYSAAAWNTHFIELLTRLSSVVNDAAVHYAHELRIPVPVKMRTVAPTGTVAKMPGVTEGIHPIYARYFERRVRFSVADPDQREQVYAALDSGLEIETDQYDPSGNTVIVVYPTKEKLVEEVEAIGHDAMVVESADEISLEAMLGFQGLYQTYWADNAVSFTANVPAEAHQEAAMLAGQPVPAPSEERVKAVASTIANLLPSLKGTTLMVDGSRPQAPYTRISESDYQNWVVSDGIDEDCMTGACPVR